MRDHHVREDDAGDAEADGADGSREDEDRHEVHLPAHLRHVGLPDPPRRTGVFVDAASLREHVGDILRAYLGGYQVDVHGNITFSYEDARVFVTVAMSPIGPQVGVFSITNLDVELSLGLATFLLSTNHALGFGAFSYDQDEQAIWLRHTLLGTTIDPPELQSAVAAVASTAAHFDHRIRDRFGGRIFSEASQDVQDAASPPPPNAQGYL